jgi:5-methylcytosine-specific restriction endonuclease McrA
MFIRLSTRLVDHPQVAIASARLGRDGYSIALGVFVRGLLWCRRHQSDQIIPHDVAAGVLRATRRTREGLVAAGLWERHADGFRIKAADFYGGPAPRVSRLIDLKLRFTVLQRDGFRCRYCGQGAPLVALEVDHVVPVSAGGSDEIANLVTACTSCNSGKSNRQLAPVTATEN